MSKVLLKQAQVIRKDHYIKYLIGLRVECMSLIPEVAHALQYELLF